MSDDQGAAAELAHAPEPAAVVRGQFALYPRAGGGMTMFYDIGQGQVRQDVPAALVAFFTGNGVMARRMRAMLGKGEQ